MPEAMDLQERLLGVMSRTQAWPIQFPQDSEASKEGVVLIGVDTNVLKMLRRSPTVTQDLSDRAREREVLLVIPGQSLTEYWNNYKTFTREELNSARSSAEKLLNLIDMPEIHSKVHEILDLLDRSLSESLEGKDLYNRSVSTVQTLLRHGRLFHVNRPLFLSAAQSRLESKMPPGFADEKTKVSSLGDFYMWADFLYGVATILAEGTAEVGRVVLVTEDSKPDWRAGGQIHPILRAESHSYLDHEVELWNFKELTRWLSQIAT